MQEQVCHTPVHFVEDLRQRLLDLWTALKKRIIDYFVIQIFADKVQTLRSFYLLN